MLNHPLTDAAEILGIKPNIIVFKVNTVKVVIMLLDFVNHDVWFAGSYCFGERHQ